MALLHDTGARCTSKRVVQAVDLLKAEAVSLEEAFNDRYPAFVQQGRITALLGLSNRIQLLRHMANQLESI